MADHRDHGAAILGHHLKSPNDYGGPALFSSKSTRRHSAVPRREGHSFIQEEQLGIAIRTHHGSPPAFELQDALIQRRLRTAE